MTSKLNVLIIRFIFLLASLGINQVWGSQSSDLLLFEQGTPAKVKRPKSPPITLIESIRCALEHSFDIAGQRLDIAVARDSLSISNALFDPVLSVAKYKDKNTSAIQNGLSHVRSDMHTANAGVGIRVRSGGELKISSQRKSTTSTLSQLNPTNDLEQTLSFSQPLLRGFGTEVTTLAVRQAEMGIDLAQYNYLDKALTIVESVEKAYYKLVIARHQLVSTQAIVKNAQTLLADVQVKLKAGFATKVHLLEAQIGVANARQRHIEAEASVNSSEDGLRALMGLSNFDLPIGETVIDDAPVDIPLDVGSAYSLALDRQPMYHGALQVLAQKRLALDEARDNLKPSVNLDLAVGFGKSPDSSTSELMRKRQSLRIGLTYTYSLGNQTESAKFRQRSAQVTQQDLLVQQMEQGIHVNVRDAIRNIQAMQESVPLAALSLNLSQQKYDAERKRFLIGSSTPRLILEALSELESARIKALEVQIQLRTAFAALRKIEGSTFDYYNINFGFKSEAKHLPTRSIEP